MTKTVKGNHAKIETTQTYIVEAKTIFEGKLSAALKKGKHSSIETTHKYLEKV